MAGALQAARLTGRIARRPTLWHALVLGVRDYLGKERLSRGHCWDFPAASTRRWFSPLRLTRWARTKVRAVMMPSPYTADISWIDARDMAARLGRALRRDRHRHQSSRPSRPPCPTVVRRARQEDTTEENLQARIRGTLLMALSNKFGSIVLTTGNKSEMATGYCTLYGDMAGGFAVIKDVAKTMVFRLARWRNAPRPLRDRRSARFLSASSPARPVPSCVRTRRTRTACRNMPVLDAIIERYMENDLSPAQIVAEGLPAGRCGQGSAADPHQ